MAAKLNFQTVPLSEIRPITGRPHAAPQPIVLVVDDEQVIDDTLAAILSRSGYTAMTAYDGSAALEIADLIPPQMMITDVSTPGMSGIELAIAVSWIHPRLQSALVLPSGIDGRPARHGARCRIRIRSPLKADASHRASRACFELPERPGL